MKYEWRSRPTRGQYEELSQRTRGQRRTGVIALICFAMICAFTLGNHVAGGNSAGANVAPGDFVELSDQDFTKADRDAADTADRDGNPVDLADAVPSRGDKLAVSKPRFAQRMMSVAALLDPHAWGFVPGRFTQTARATDGDTTSALPPQHVAALDPWAEIKSAPVPLPTPSPLSRIRNALLHDAARATDKQSEPTIFERLFGKLTQPATLAYASPDDAGLLANSGAAAGRYDRDTAVYDIAAHMVYLPDGRALEAHSGYGPLLDDPHHADVRMRGVTPPTMYDLHEREALFHGVRALRLIPKDESKVFGRAGLLAHTFMLGPNGDSNGCVSFRDYDAFLHAYLNGEIKHLVVVSSL
ncbi:MAG TPA: DUF2778 domain-containing protein [Xanthobacteraceae bacterium]|jgi:hypothetical protein|nr:DUF2778 domain-containing protein [Xanthobacteraceae bacterium]